MSTKWLLLAFVVVFQACSPTLTPFTQRLYEENRWTESELKKIQFYLSEDIVMQRTFGGNASEITAGEIKVINGRKVEEIVIPKGTPGIYLFSPKSERFAISFEDGSDQRFLVFGPNPKARSRYALMAKDWNRKEGRVTYEGNLYRVDVSSAYAGLLVDLKKINRVIVDRRRATGRTVKN